MYKNKKAARVARHFFISAMAIACLFVGKLAVADEFAAQLQALNEKSFNEIIKTVDALMALNDERTLPTLKALQDASLFSLKADGRIVIAEKEGGTYSLTDPLTMESAGTAVKKDLSKVRINNSVRRKLREVLAILELYAKEPEVRLAAAQNLFKNPDKDLRATVVETLDKEQESDVREALELVLALIDIDGSDAKLRAASLEVLGNSIESEAIVVVRRLAERSEDGKFIEADTELAQAAENKINHIDAKLGLYKIIENTLFGLSLGSVLLLAAIGLAITFGVMGVINMAHGEMIMLGAYTTFAVQQIFPNLIEVSLFIAVPAAFLVSGLTGVLIERLVIRHLYGRTLDTLLATFGISLILQQAVRLYSANNVAVITPQWMSGLWQINPALALTYNRVYIVIFSLVVLALLALLLKKTMIGLQMRAVTQNRAMATSMGIRSNWVDALTFGLGSGIAGMAGVALSQITNVGPNLGQGYIIDSFMVVVFGGVGNLFGTFFAAMSLGVVNKFLEPFSGAVLGKIFVLIFIILFIQWRPRGLFALKGRFVED